MPTFTNDISDVHVGNQVNAELLQADTDEANDTVVPKVRFGHRPDPVTPVANPPAANVVGDMRIIVERSEGQDISRTYTGVAVAVPRGGGQTVVWTGAAIAGFTDVTTVTRVNYYWTQTG